MVDFFICFYGIILLLKCSQTYTMKVESRGIREVRRNSNCLNLILVTLVDLLTSEIEFRVRAA